eukprot:COSAG02_NODE_5680_length_4131_cov_4.013641_4_plen_74_part_00
MLLWGLRGRGSSELPRKSCGGYITDMNGSEMVATTHGAHPRPQPHGRPSGLACFACGVTVTAQDASRSGLAGR